ncbi:extracellular solute-binding protein [Paenibacillus hemerocallicola]|uniref:Extracellular solute-binding protein n=1 Tax=Paenibacillus hemerocallicola TaxID=1172614 RepID=A0A5C4SZ45_9BACL|nr:extracellular solute-binding protein [Paenibacillus hemerocallicola]TNJ62032.1 extracellular solute-binding protein [Paenibacillus hemerocallicola]
MTGNRKRFVALAPLLTFAIVLAGCGGRDAGNAKEERAEPVTLQLASQSVGTLLDEDFQEVVRTHLGKKYPHITINYNPETKGTTLTELIAAGSVPDIVVTYTGVLPSYRDMRLVMDMTSHFKNQGVDLDRFEPNYMTDVRKASDKGELYGLPINVNYHAMYYNKDIFDKFGVPYPTDGMLWQGVIDLANRVTRMDGGVQYRGFDPGSTVQWMSQPLAIAAIDPLTDKATMNNDSWKRVFELARSIYSIPGNGLIAETPKNQFMKSRTLAMLLDLNILNQLAAPENAGLNWNVVQYPSYPEKPNTYGNASVYTVIATKASKYKDEAAKVIDVITSEEVQLELSRRGKLSPLRSENVKQALGAANSSLKDKGLPGIFKSKPVPYPVASTYRGKAEAIAIAKFKLYLEGALDVNTAIAQADEEINKRVDAEKGSAK